MYLILRFLFLNTLPHYRKTEVLRELAYSTIGEEKVQDESGTRKQENVSKIITGTYENT